MPYKLNCLCVYTLHLHAYYIGQALFQLKFGSVHHFSGAIFEVCLVCMDGICFDHVMGA